MTTDLAAFGLMLSTERDCAPTVVPEGDCHGLLTLFFGCLAQERNDAADFSLRGIFGEMEVVFILEHLKLLMVAEAVVLVRSACGLVDAGLLGTEGFASLRGADLADGGVETADCAVGVLLDLFALFLELEAECVHSFFKFVHTVVRLALQAEGIKRRLPYPVAKRTTVFTPKSKS